MSDKRIYLVYYVNGGREECNVFYSMGVLAGSKSEAVDIALKSGQMGGGGYSWDDGEDDEPLLDAMPLEIIEV